MFLDLFIFILCSAVLSVYMSVHHMCTVPTETRENTGFMATRCVLGIEPRLSGKAARVLYAEPSL